MLARVVDIHRFNEGGGTYDSFTVITYFGTEATLQCLDRSISVAQARDLVTKLREQGMKTMRYYRNGRLKIQRLTR